MRGHEMGRHLAGLELHRPVQAHHRQHLPDRDREEQHADPDRAARAGLERAQREQRHHHDGQRSDAREHPPDHWRLAGHEPRLRVQPRDCPAQRRDEGHVARSAALHLNQRTPGGVADGDGLAVLQPDGGDVAGGGDVARLEGEAHLLDRRELHAVDLARGVDDEFVALQLVGQLEPDRARLLPVGRQPVIVLGRQGLDQGHGESLYAMPGAGGKSQAHPRHPGPPSRDRRVSLDPRFRCARTGPGSGAGRRGWFGKGGPRRQPDSCIQTGRSAVVHGVAPRSPHR